MFKKIVYACIAFLLITFLALMLWNLQLRQRNPLLLLAKYESSLINIIEARSRNGDRLTNDLTLINFLQDSIKIRISRPANDSIRLPVILVLGGFQIGKNSLNYIRKQGTNAFLSYDYPISRSGFDMENPIDELFRLRSELLKVPAQFLVIQSWLYQQSWVDTNRINIMGYSFGALILPAIQHYTQQNGTYSSTIISYGAIDIDELLFVNFGNQSIWINSVTCHFIQSLIYPIEPRVHLSNLNGQFLLMNGKLDQRIPFSKALQLQELVPEPKTIMNLEEGHMHPRKPKLTQKIIKLSRKWLLERKLIN